MKTKRPLSSKSIENNIKQLQVDLENLRIAKDQVEKEIIDKQVRLALLRKNFVESESESFSASSDGEQKYTGLRDINNNKIYKDSTVIFETKGTGKFKGAKEGKVLGITKPKTGIRIAVPGISEPTWRSPKSLRVKRK